MNMSRPVFFSLAKSDYFRYHRGPLTFCIPCSVCQDQLQTCRMARENINSQPPERATVDSARGCPASETLPAGILHAGGLGRIAMLSADSEGRITGCSEAALDIFSHTAAEVLGRPLAAFFLNGGEREEHQLQQAVLSGALKQGQYRSSIRFQAKSGKTIAIELFVTLLRDGSSAPTGMVALFSATEEKLKIASVPEIQGEAEEPAHTVSREIDGTN